MFIVALTGASGMLYAQNLIRHLTVLKHEVLLTFTPNSETVLKHELGMDPARFIKSLKAGKLVTRVGVNDVTHRACAGSFRHSGMIIVPASINTMSRIASGLAGNIIERAAQVCLKEKYPLVIVLRETPLSPVILENMLRLAQAGAVILPAAPGFYTKPETISDLADFISAKIMNILSLPHRIKLYEV